MIIGYIGRRGGGKTLSMVRQTLNDYNNGRQIYSNIKLNIPHTLLSKELLEDFVNGNSSLVNCVVLLDEAHMYIDSRMSPSKRNLLISYFLLQTRKRDVDVYYTTQSRDQVDKRLRKQTDLYVFCSSMTINNESFNGDDDVFIRNVVVDPFAKGRKKSYFYANDFYNLYDTYEIVSFN